MAFDGQMGKPTVGGRSMPMDDSGSDLHHVARSQFPGRSVFFLIIPYSAYRDQYLPAGMAVPMVAARGFEGYVRYRNSQFRISGQRRQVRTTGKVPGIRRVFFSHRKSADCLGLFFCFFHILCGYLAGKDCQEHSGENKDEGFETMMHSRGSVLFFKDKITGNPRPCL